MWQLSVHQQLSGVSAGQLYNCCKRKRCLSLGFSATVAIMVLFDGTFIMLCFYSSFVLNQFVIISRSLCSIQVCWSFPRCPSSSWSKTLLCNTQHCSATLGTALLMLCCSAISTQQHSAPYRFGCHFQLRRTFAATLALTQ